ncbi:hypothetical protein CRUP_017524 [Coryphaenoides rupestris]|nr:hypothetical protein CRUP_017524 [Coryphaenoides rupestris]
MEVWKRYDFCSAVVCAALCCTSHRVEEEQKITEFNIDKDTDLQYSLSTDAELISIKSLTLGKVTGADITDEAVRQAGLKGFIGCLSSVQFNHVAPLKAALLNPGSSLVSVRGQLVESNCGMLADSKLPETVDRGKEPLTNGNSARQRTVQEKENRQALETAYRAELQYHSAAVMESIKGYYI